MNTDVSHIEKTDIVWILNEEESKENFKKYGKKSQDQCTKAKNFFINGDFDQAYNEFIKLKKNHPKEESFKLATIASALENGKNAEAKKLSKSLDPHHYWYFEGVAADHIGEVKHAVVCYEKAIAENETFVPALFRLAYYNDLYGNEHSAMKLYERCIPLRPLHTNILMNLGILYEDAGKYDKAIECYEKILLRYPDNLRVKLYLKDAMSSITMYVDEEKEKLKDQRNEILSTPITDFELSVRSRNCLNKMKIKSLGDLIKKSEPELLSYKNFGETSLAEIKEILDRNNLSLGMGEEKFLEQQKSEAQMINLSKDEDSPILDQSITALDLSVRSHKCLTKIGVNTVSDLIAHTEEELLNCNNFGNTSMLEIKKKLTEMELSLKSPVE